MATKNILIVGVGGQGTLLASKLMGKCFMQEGYDVKVSEVHGMSQRGGSVVTYVRYGEKVYSPVIEKAKLTSSSHLNSSKVQDGSPISKRVAYSSQALRKSILCP